MIDQEIEVTKDQYNILRNTFSGIIAHRHKNDKYYIKIWYTKYEKLILQTINNGNN